MLLMMMMMMKLSVLPPLVLLCSNLLMQNPSTVFALHFNSPATQSNTQALVMTSRRPSNLIFHPSTDSCIVRTSLNDPLRLGPCDQSDGWAYTPQKFLMVKGTYFCLKAVDSGKPAELSIQCSESDSSWNMGLNGKTSISTKLPDGDSLCLEVGSDGTIMTNPCLCDGGGRLCGAESQIFEFAVRPITEVAPNLP